MFEPNPKNFELLQSRFKENPKFHLFNVAVSNKAGQASFSINPYDKTGGEYREVGNMRRRSSYYQ